VVLGEFRGQFLIGEAKAPYVRIMPISSLTEEYELVDVNDKNIELTSAAKDEIIELTGLHYGYFEILGFLWSKTFKKVNPFTDNFVCSEYVAIFLKSAGIFPEDVDVNNITPQEIYERLKWKE
jgi:hypothetical protein